MGAAAANLHSKVIAAPPVARSSIVQGEERRELSRVWGGPSPPSQTLLLSDTSPSLTCRGGGGTTLGMVVGQRQG